jgi:hypothetical protein
MEARRDLHAPEYILPPLPNFASLRVAGVHFAVPILAGDGGDKIIQTVIPRSNRGDHDAAFGDANIDRMAFMHFDLIGKSFGYPKGKTVSPFLQNGFHDVDTSTIPDAARKIKSRDPRRQWGSNFVAGATLSAYESRR